MMKKYLFNFVLIFPLVISNQSTSKIESITKTQVNGGSSSVSAQVTNVVNQNEVIVKSQKEGEIKVEKKNGQTTIETTDNSIEIIVPTGTIAPVPTIIEFKEETFENTENIVEKIQKQISELFNNIFLRIPLFSKNSS